MQVYSGHSDHPFPQQGADPARPQAAATPVAASFRAQALPLAVATMQACEFVGLPECQLSLAQAVTYLACAPKSNASTVAISMARHDVREGRTVPVPRHLRDKHYSGAKRLGHGEGYEYAHNAEDGIATQDYLGVEREYYTPVPRGYEVEIGERLAQIRAKLRATGE